MHFFKIQNSQNISFQGGVFLTLGRKTNRGNSSKLKMLKHFNSGWSTHNSRQKNNTGFFQKLKILIHFMSWQSIPNSRKKNNHAFPQNSTYSNMSIQNRHLLELNKERPKQALIQNSKYSKLNILEFNLKFNIWGLPLSSSSHTDTTCVVSRIKQKSHNDLETLTHTKNYLRGSTNLPMCSVGSVLSIYIEFTYYKFFYPSSYWYSLFAHTLII